MTTASVSSATHVRQQNIWDRSKTRALSRLLGLLVGLCLAVFARNHLDKKIDLSDLVEWISGTIAAARSGSGVSHMQIARQAGGNQ